MPVIFPALSDVLPHLSRHIEFKGLFNPPARRRVSHDTGGSDGKRSPNRCPKRCVTSNTSPRARGVSPFVALSAPLICVERRCARAQARRQQRTNIALAPRSSRWAFAVSNVSSRLTTHTFCGSTHRLLATDPPPLSTLCHKTTPPLSPFPLIMSPSRLISFISVKPYRSLSSYVLL